MFWWLSKKNIKNSFEGVKKDFIKISQSFKKRDKRINNHENKLNNLNNQINSNSLKIARLEGIISTLINQKSQSQSLKVLPNLNKSQENIETKLIKRIRRSKRTLVMGEINKLTPTHTTIEMFEVIVKEKGLCSKATFYRYIASLKESQESQKFQKEVIETEAR